MFGTNSFDINHPKLINSKVKNYNLNVTEVRDSDFKNAFSGNFQLHRRDPTRQRCPSPLFLLISYSRFNPSVTDLLISIYTNLNNDEKVVQVLDESIEYQKKNSSDSANLVKMLRLSGSFLLP